MPMKNDDDDDHDDDGAGLRRRHFVPLLTCVAVVSATLDVFNTS